jgi:hypothetical protein
MSPPESRITGTAAIHLVTVLYNSAESLPVFLDSLLAQDTPDWHLHVIDNASPDTSASIVTGRPDPRITVYRNTKNLGFAKAANQGLRNAHAAGAELLVLINNDTAFAQDLLRRLVAARIQLDAPVIAPRIMRREQPDKPWYAGGRLDYGWVFTNIHHEQDPAAGTAPEQVDFAPGCCLGIDRHVLEQVGLLDESFFVYWEDTDFCLRLKSLNIPIMYLPELSLLHDGGAACGGEFSPAYLRLYYRSYMQLLRKHFGRPNAIRTMLRLLLRENSRPNRNVRALRTILRAMLGGLGAPLIAQTKL